MHRGLAILTALAGIAVARGENPQAVWERAVKAKGGRERLHSVHSLAIYMKPAQVNLPGPAQNWLCVFPDRYFEYDGKDSGKYPYVAANGIGYADSPRAIVVDRSADRVAMDATGAPRGAWRLTQFELDRMAVNQVVFLLENGAGTPRPLEAKKNEVTVQTGGLQFRVHLDKSDLPERVVALPMPGEKRKLDYDYRLQHYREYGGVMLPARVAWVAGVRQWTWDVDYEIDAKYNPKLFERVPKLGDGPEPWRLR